MPRSNETKRYLVKVADMLAAAVFDSGMTQRDLAARLNVSEARISQILNGEANLTIQTIIKITHILGMELHVSLVKKEANC